jgi:hypothetical protein
MKARLIKFGEMEIEGKCYTHDVVIEGGKVRKRKKGPSKQFREEFGHTPLSAEEEIPWRGKRLIVGTGAQGALPVMDEVLAEAKRRGIEVIAASTLEVCQLLEEVKRGRHTLSCIARANGGLEDGIGLKMWPSANSFYKNSRVTQLVSEIDAGLGRKDQAIPEARRAVDLKPIAKDPFEHAGSIVNLALVYAWTGERARALEQLEIVAAIPAGPTYGDLLLNPCWDDLRGDKRFDKNVAAAKAAGK